MAGRRPRGQRAGHPPGDRRGPRPRRVAKAAASSTRCRWPSPPTTRRASIDPRGLHCDTLTARLHVVDAVTTALRTLDACLARCDLEIAELVSAPMAAGLATLVEDERQLGATVLDMGGGTTGMAVFAEGQLLHTAQLPIGGMHVTNDIARILSTPVAHAERLKTLYGSAQSSPDDEREMLPVPLVGEEEHQIAKVPRSMVVNIIQPRLEETFEMVQGTAGQLRPRPRRRPPRGADRRRLPALRRARDGAPDPRPPGPARPPGTVARPARQRLRPGLRHRRRPARLGRRRGPHPARHRPRRRTARAACCAGSSISSVSACDARCESDTRRYNAISWGSRDPMTLNLTIPQQMHTDFTPRITVIGVGGGGTNAVDNMIAHEPAGRGVRGRQHRRAAAGAFARRPPHPARPAHHPGPGRRRQAGDRPRRRRGSRRRAVSPPRRRPHGVHHRRHGRRHRHRCGPGDRPHGPRAQHPDRRRGDQAVHLRRQPSAPAPPRRASTSCSSTSTR